MFHGYLTAAGQKISKSLGNVVDPLTPMQKYDFKAFAACIRGSKKMAMLFSRGML